jgi:serine/threonine protein kinase
MPEKLLQYDVIETLGQGAKSTIYAVVDPTTGRQYALKHVIRKDTKDLRFVEQVESEYEISKQFNHVNLRKSFDLKVQKKFFVQVAEAFLLMELFKGKSLEERPPSNMDDFVSIFLQTAEGLRAMHKMGYVHCDLKPNNILRDDTGHVKVIDFGQSCPVNTTKERIQGTPDYIAPEQVARRPVTTQTDIFNLGATMYWCLVGKTIPTLYTVNKKGENSFLLDSAIDTPQQLNPRVPISLSNLIMESVSTNPKKRPADMDQVITRLELVKHVLGKQQPAPQPARPSIDDLESDTPTDTFPEAV